MVDTFNDCNNFNGRSYIFMFKKKNTLQQNNLLDYYFIMNIEWLNKNPFLFSSSLFT